VLSTLRIGCVQYLNSKPLITAYPGDVVLDHPSRLAAALSEDRMDAALVPIFEAFSTRPYLAVDGVAIASDGPVYSVFLAYLGDLSQIRTLALDPASLTSAHLVQVLLREYHGIAPECTRREADLEAGEAQLLIGNQAIEFRRKAPAEVKFLDLGEEWKLRTGLPFVFALWLLRPTLEDSASVGKEFRRLKAEGTALIRKIAQKEECIGPDLALRYLTEYIHFDLGPREKEGIEKFRALLLKHHLLTNPGEPLRFV
jgi:chorismate dehydratase